MRKAPSFAWILTGIAVSLLLPALGSLVSEVWLAESTFNSAPVHSLIEAAGGLMALAIAGILIAERPRKKDADHYVWMACALVGMGVLDLFHAGVDPGKKFVWLHSTATFVGGVLFACVWLPGKILPKNWGNRLSALVAVVSLALSTFSCVS